MTDLPLEILRLTSKYLAVKDLIQFQLVNKNWREASTESLYSKLDLDFYDPVFFFKRTISSSRNLGTYVRIISAQDFFSPFEGVEIKHQKEFLDDLIKYCPNIREIRAPFHSELWTRLGLAASNGELPNLQCLPENCDDSMELYVSTALKFRHSLTHVTLSDIPYRGYDMSGPFDNMYEHLRDRITRFTNLQHLTIMRSTNQPFNSIDEIIENCPQLIELNVELYSNGDIEDIDELYSILPRPQIRKLTCNWTGICEEGEFGYLIEKFTNLQHLVINYGAYFHMFRLDTADISHEVMMDFMDYISAIKNIDLTLITLRSEFTEYWNELIKMRKDLSKVCISYNAGEGGSDIYMVYNKKLLTLAYVLGSTETTLPHEEFLKENGRMIKSLSMQDTLFADQRLDRGSIIKSDILCNANWIYRTLAFCPSLQELTLRNLVELKYPSNYEYQHTGLKKLCVFDEDRITSLKFLKDFSARAPNLKELTLSICYRVESKNEYYIKIDMPKTSFDIITVNLAREKSMLEEYYIKLNTIDKERYFLAGKNGTRELSCTIYQQSEKPHLFEITCKDLKQFKLLRPDARCAYRGKLERLSKF